MLIIETVEDLQNKLNEKRSNNQTIGFVPTMGFLHDGHMSLVEKAKSECDTVVVSIFVNPTQFGEGEDLDVYPRDLARDQKLCEDYAVDFIFFPKVEEMYPEDDINLISYPDLMKKLCGLFRPGHFEGVVTIMDRFLSIVGPCNCYMGKKDAQQLVVVKHLAQENFPNVKIVGCSLVREDTGLAMSSRNYYLSNEEKEKATLLFKALNKFVNSLVSNHEIDKLLRRSINYLEAGGFDVQYFSFVDAQTLDDVKEFIPGSYLLAVAAKLDKTRLIDNFGVIVNEDLAISVDRGMNKLHKEVQG